MPSAPHTVPEMRISRLTNTGRATARHLARRSMRAVVTEGGRRLCEAVAPQATCRSFRQEAQSALTGFKLRELLLLRMFDKTPPAALYKCRRRGASRSNRKPEACHASRLTANNWPSCVTSRAGERLDRRYVEDARSTFEHRKRPTTAQPRVCRRQEHSPFVRPPMPRILRIGRDTVRLGGNPISNHAG